MVTKIGEEALFKQYCQRARVHQQFFTSIVDRLPCLKGKIHAVLYTKGKVVLYLVSSCDYMFIQSYLSSIEEICQQKRFPPVSSVVVRVSSPVKKVDLTSKPTRSRPPLSLSDSLCKLSDRVENSKLKSSLRKWAANINSSRDTDG